MKNSFYLLILALTLSLATACGDDQKTIEKLPGDDVYVEVLGCNAEVCGGTCCGNVCRDTMSNSRHCGSCGNACNVGEVCIDAVCVKPMTQRCETGQMRCGESCVDIVSNVLHCGACDQVCEAGELCHERRCVKDCGRLTECDGICTDMSTDSLNCGGCGTPCAAESFCELGVCWEHCKEAGHLVCQHKCTDPQVDPDNCGECGLLCAEGEICKAGECSDECEAPNHVICDRQCIGIESSNEHCGACANACASTSYCDMGECKDACDIEGETVCEHLCVDTQSDLTNCGSCGTTCIEREICIEGSCQCPEGDPDCREKLLVCEDGEIVCDKRCQNILTDVENCGDCGVICEELERCVAGACVGCGDLTTCDDGSCRDLTSDPQNCGVCGNVCLANVACVDSQCSGCLPNYVDCDGDPSNGCEKTTADCACTPGETRGCYFGPPGTENVGSCRSGEMTCSDGQWGECVGQVLPNYAIVCDPSKPTQDLDCNGIPDGTGDADGDGFSLCQGDCCDTNEMCPGISDSKLIGPHMLEIPKNKVDDNCNGVVDEVYSGETCNASYVFGTDLTSESARNAAALQLAHGMDICQTADKGYGLVSARLQSLNAGTRGNAAFGKAVNVLPYLASTIQSTVPIVSPKKGSTFSLLSSGEAISANALKSSNFIAGGTIPQPYNAAHGGALQSFPGCGSASNINDTVHLELELQAPKNANGFAFDFKFASAEYPVFICSSYNDFFLALSSSKHKDIPADGNIAFDVNGNPVSVNNAFFTICEPISCGSCKPIYTKGCVAGKCETAYGACPDGTAELPAYKVGSGGGATAWLTTKAPILPGEKFKLNFYIWDTGDSNLDSLVIIDNFRWELDTTVLGTGFTDPRD